MEIRWSILFGRTLNAESQMFWIYHILMVRNPNLSIDVVTKKHSAGKNVFWNTLGDAHDPLLCGLNIQ